jgi:hypothetical protein
MRDGSQGSGVARCHKGKTPWSSSAYSILRFSANSIRLRSMELEMKLVRSFSASFRNWHVLNISKLI